VSRHSNLSDLLSLHSFLKALQYEPHAAFNTARQFHAALIS